MNEANVLIETLFAGFLVDGNAIPVSFLRYDGASETYVTYAQTDAGNTLSADDDLINYAEYYDFDVFSKGNYFPIIESIITILKANGFIWQPSRSSGDMYEDDTGYFHRTLNFAYLKGE